MALCASLWEVEVRALEASTQLTAHNTVFIHRAQQGGPSQITETDHRAQLTAHKRL